MDLSVKIHTSTNVNDNIYRIVGIRFSFLLIFGKMSPTDGGDFSILG